MLSLLMFQQTNNKTFPPHNYFFEVKCILRDQNPRPIFVAVDTKKNTIQKSFWINDSKYKQEYIWKPTQTK